MLSDEDICCLYCAAGEKAGKDEKAPIQSKVSSILFLANQAPHGSTKGKAIEVKRMASDAGVQEVLTLYITRNSIAVKPMLPIFGRRERRRACTTRRRTTAQRGVKSAAKHGLWE
mmetsp:Transcript_22510/g.49728  ORF Transcript_22510/g.49728 Transcript_22510/m.49728 type:complete len:115 (+) Transcript_22510:1-345(+)